MTPIIFTLSVASYHPNLPASFWTLKSVSLPGGQKESVTLKASLWNLNLAHDFSLFSNCSFQLTQHSLQNTAPMQSSSSWVPTLALLNLNLPNFCHRLFHFKALSETMQHNSVLASDLGFGWIYLSFYGQ